MLHDASFDADLLKRVFQVYLKSWSHAVDLGPHMIPTKDSLLNAQIHMGKLKGRKSYIFYIQWLGNCNKG